MDSLPFDPQIIIFLVFLLIGATKNFLKKGKEKEDIHYPPYAEPQRSAPESLSDFKRMIEEAKAEVMERRGREENKALPEPPLDPLDSPSFRPSQPEPVVQPVAPPPARQSPERHSSSIFPSAAMASRGQKVGRRQGSIGDLLRSPKAARQAIILTEVLGKPKGMR